LSAARANRFLSRAEAEQWASGLTLSPEEPAKPKGKQICFGVEIVSTDDADTTFQVPPFRSMRS